MSISSIQHTSGLPAFGEHLPHTEAERADVSALHYMQARLREYISQSDTTAALPGIVQLLEPDRRQHRIVLLNRVALYAGGEFTFVGFFGRKRTDADASLLDALDAELIQELYESPHMLSYSSLELQDGSWGNLVVVSSPQGAVHWASGARHAYAAHTVAPASYTTIRLHTGVIMLNGAVDTTLHIKRTKHFAWENC